MGTRAAAFTAKVRHLLDYHARIQQNMLPLPSGTDIANTLKYFSQTLLSVLKDVPTIPLAVIRSSEKDHYRTSLFPCLDYKGLYHAVIQLVDAVPLIQYGAHAMGHTILNTLVCLVPFLEHEYMDTLPYIIASSMAHFPTSLHRDIVDTLCNHLLWFTFRESADTENQNYTFMSTSAILMMVFQYSESSALCYQLLECLMSMKQDVMKDVFCVIAHGTARARSHAIELLFQYWPSLNKCIHERKGFIFKHHGWKPLMCQQENCLSPINNDAMKMCFDHVIAIGSGEHAPPLYVCQDCADQIIREHGANYLLDVLLPIEHISTTCENKNCHSSDNSAVVTCFSIDCVSSNGNRPIKYCNDCHMIYHTKEKNNHMVHGIVPSPWEVDLETQCYMVEAIVSLLREAQPNLDKPIRDNGGERQNLSDSDDDVITSLEERQLLSQFGIWLLVGLCVPTEDTPVETLGRLLSMLFQWFHYTACLPDDQAGNTLERLKTEYIHGWLMGIVKTHFDVFVSCLLPHPAEYAQVGGHWDVWPSQMYRIKEGFKRLLCLVPYDIITPEIWEYIMPFWMEAFRYEIPEEELSEFKILLSKVLDPDLSPLGFSTEEMYRFLSSRFENSTAPVQEQSLYWLQILTMLEVPIPLDLILTMFSNGVKSTVDVQEEVKGKLTKVIPRQQTVMTAGKMETIRPTSRSDESPNVAEDYTLSHSIDFKSDAEINLTCFILMIDTLIKQLELQEVPPHKGLEQSEAQKVMTLLHDIIKAPWVGIHTCADNENDKEDGPCLFCEISAVWYQLAMIIMEYFCPVMEVTMADIPVDSHKAIESPIHISHAWKGEDAKHGHEEKPLGVKTTEEKRSCNWQQLDESYSKRQSTDSSSHFPIMTATVEECTSELDTVAIMPTEQVVTAYAHAVTLTEDDVARAKCTIVSATLMDENDQTVTNLQESDDGFWHTTQGRFKFTLEELPAQLQLLYVLLKQLDESKDADVLYHILSCLKLMCLHSEVLNKAAHDHRGFLIWCQENLLITNLWKLLQAEFSHISQLSVSLLLHCVTLPCGTDMFWKVVEHDFHNENWRAVFASVEKVTMIAHFVDASLVKNSPFLQTSLANAFAYLVRCLDDSHQVIAQRALLNLETIRTSSLKLFLWCLEVQFDTVIVDRPIILQTIYQLYNHLSDRRFLTWDFFLNRFDALFLEAQISLELTYTRDLKNSNIYSEMFQRKLNRANEALSHNARSRSLISSIGSKWPYKRAMSAPGGMISKQEKWVDKDKLYSRQSSAPVLKRKSLKLIAGIHSGPLMQHLPNSFFSDSQSKEQAQEEIQLLHILQRCMDMDDHDKETSHMLIFVLMQYLATPDPSHPYDGKVIGRNQHLVLRHVNLLLGYSPTEKGFLIPPYKLRSSPVFNAFITSLSKVLDYNFKMGTILLPICLPVLIYCPSPQRFSYESQPPDYSLWLLHSYIRHSWLTAVMVIMYKYNYTSVPQSKQVEILVHIILNTLNSHQHQCRSILEPILSPLPSRSRDLSTASADMENVQEKGSPPYGSLLSANEGKVSVAGSQAYFYKVGGLDLEDEYEKDDQKFFKDKTDHQQWKGWKPLDISCSSDGEDVEPELEVIPESPKSETSDIKRTSECCELNVISSEHLEEQAIVKVVLEKVLTNEKVTILDPLIELSAETMVITDQKQKVGNDIMEHYYENTPWTNEISSKTSLDLKHELVSEDKVDTSVQIIEKSVHENMEKHSGNVGKTTENQLEISQELEKLDFNADLGKLPKFSQDNLNDQTNAQKAFATKFLFQADNDDVPSSSYSEFSVEEFTYQKTDNDVSQSENLTETSTASNKTLFQTTKLTEFNLKSTETVLLDEKNKQMDQLTSVSKTKDNITENSFQLDFSDPKTEQNNKILNNITSEILDSSEKNQTLAVDKPDMQQKAVQTDFPTRIETCKNSTKDILSHDTHKISDNKLASKPSKEDHEFLKKDKQQLWKIDFHSPISLQSFIPKPTPERLLPIGPTKELESPTADQAVIADPKSTDESCLSEVSNKEVLESSETTTSTLPELLQPTKKQNINVPTPERLLPIGTTILKKDDTFDALSTEIKTDEKSKVEVFDEKFKSIETDDDVQNIEIKIPLNLIKTTETEKELPEKIAETNLDVLKPSVTVPLLLINNIESEKYTPTSDVQSRFHTTVNTEPSNDQVTPQYQEMVKSITEDNLDRPSLPLESTEKTDEKKVDYNDFHITDHFHVVTEGLKNFSEGTQILDETYRFVESEKQENFENKIEDTSHATDEKVTDDTKGRLHYRQRKQRKPGLGITEMQKPMDTHAPISRRSRKTDCSNISTAGFTSKRSSTSQQSGPRHPEDKTFERCNDCGGFLEEYSDEELGLCIVILSTFVHREPALAAPLLPEMLKAVVRIASCSMYAWQSESNTHLPGSAVSVARQFLRCTLHQLAPNDIFVQIFQSQFDTEFFKTIAAALADFIELNQVSPLLFLFESLNERKHLSFDSVLYVLMNVNKYLNCLPVESNILPWSVFLPQYEIFLRKLLLILPMGPCDLTSALHIMKSILKMSIISSCKSILDPSSKILCHAIQYSSLHYADLIEICQLCYRNLARERDKLTFSHTIVFEIIQALKFKSSIPDDNLLTLVQLVLQDAGGILVPNVAVDSISPDIQNMHSTGISECMRQHLNDCLEFVADVHALTKLKSNFHGASSQLNEETLGGQLKAGIAQYLSIEISKGNGRDNRAIGKYLPWLYHPPSLVQQGPKEFIDCVAHIRLLSWLLLGALMHSALLQNTASFLCQPVPMEANGHIAEHIQVILAGFAEQSKASVLHMSSLFHAFILCQLWTMYCEHMIFLNPPGSEQNQLYSLSLTDFWAKVTPGILQLICHSKVLAEMVSLHFLSLMEALLECNSTVLARLLPMWTPVLYSYEGQLPGHLQVRLQNCLNWKPPFPSQDIASVLLKWLQRLQFKMGQIELQSSQATQFYSI